MKCNWCHKRFTSDEIDQLKALPTPWSHQEIAGQPVSGPRICTHAGIDMKFHVDCYQLHVARTH